MRMMIVVTHLLGTGHLSRAIALGRGFQAEGFEVMLVTGGMPVAHLDTSGFEIVQLAPLKVIGTDFSTLLTDQGVERDETLTAQRIATLLQAYRSFTPDVLITELFPLGRRSLRAEYDALLQAASDSLVLASVRDILAAPSKPKRAAEAIERLQNHYDGVLVHASSSFIRLDQSWPVTPQMAEMLHYTGFVAPSLPDAAPTGDGMGEILVTAGGGAVGDALFEATLQAAARMSKQRWRLLVGGGDPERVTRLSGLAGSNVVVEATRPDFREMLQRASALVAQCGYNTALDVLAAGKPAVFVPFEDGGETEQLTRAEALLRIGPYTVVREQDLGPDNLVLAATQAISSRHIPDRAALSLDGARESARIAKRLLAGRV